MYYVLLRSHTEMAGFSLTGFSLHVGCPSQSNNNNKPVGDWISVPSPNFVAMETRVGPAFCMVPKNPLVGANISGLSTIQADL